MKRGRPSKPKELKKLEGTYREDRDGGVLQFEKITEIPKAPTQLTRTAKKIWKEITEVMITAQVLETIDIHTVAMLCEELATYYEMNKVIKKHGYTYRNQHNNLVKRPEVTIRREAHEAAKSLAAQLGLTPAARQNYGISPDSSATGLPKGGPSLR